MNGFEVKRDSNIVYLGVPNPFQRMKVAKFFEPLLQQCSVSLNKIIRAKLTHENATTVIARKIIPMLCYAAKQHQIEDVRHSSRTQYFAKKHICLILKLR